MSVLNVVRRVSIGILVNIVEQCLKWKVLMKMSKRRSLKEGLELYDAEQQRKKNPNKNRKMKHISTKEKLRQKLTDLKYRYLTNKRPDLAKKMEDDINALE